MSCSTSIVGQTSKLAQREGGLAGQGRRHPASEPRGMERVGDAHCLPQASSLSSSPISSSTSSSSVTSRGGGVVVTEPQMWPSQQARGGLPRRVNATQFWGWGRGCPGWPALHNEVLSLWGPCSGALLIDI